MPNPASSHDDEQLVAALRRGDESAFAELIDRHSPALLRVAENYVPSRAVAEEVVQEAWIAVMRGAVRFEGRSSSDRPMSRSPTAVGGCASAVSSA
jgi:RNA polymerase sigma-70 factor, ECF subfamily